MTVATPHATFTARDGRVAVLWSHGRLTEHRRDGAKPARTVGRHFDSAEASDWARKHGFEIVGLPGDEPRVLVAPLDDIDRIGTGGEMAKTSKTETTAAVVELDDPPPKPLIHGSLRYKGKKGEAESTRRSERVSDLIAGGAGATAAIEQVASEVGVAPTAIMASYYAWRKKRLAVGAELPIPPRGHKLPPRVEPVEPAPEPVERAVTVALDPPPSEPPATVAATNGHGSPEVAVERVRAHAVSPIAGEEVDPLRQVDVSNREMARVLVNQWHGLIDARAALEQELEQTMDAMSRIETQQARLRGAATALGIELPERPTAT